MEQKTIWMRFLLTGISILIIIAYNSCIGRVDPLKKVNYIYKNRTGVDLVMEVFNSYDGARLIKSFEIKNGGEVETNTTESEVPSLFSFISSYGGKGDSIVVRFSDKKCLYLSKSISSEIFVIQKYDNYSEELLKESKYTLYYTFTEADYDASVDCE
jgi:hypothetical protein